MRLKGCIRKKGTKIAFPITGGLTERHLNLKLKDYLTKADIKLISTFLKKNAPELTISDLRAMFDQEKPWYISLAETKTNCGPTNLKRIRKFGFNTGLIKKNYGNADLSEFSYKSKTALENALGYYRVTINDEYLTGEAPTIEEIKEFLENQDWISHIRNLRCSGTPQCFDDIYKEAKRYSIVPKLFQSRK